MNRRGFLGGLLALAAPAIIRTPGLLMPIKAQSGWCSVKEILPGVFFPLPPLKQEGALVAFDNPDQVWTWTLNWYERERETDAACAISLS